MSRQNQMELSASSDYRSARFSTYLVSWLSKFWGLLVTISISSLIFFTSARLDPEPYHDGAQFAPAIAVADGLSIHSDVFDAYGPITAWLQALAVNILGPEVLSIRLFTAFLLVTASALMFVIAKKVLIHDWMALLIALLWVTIWPGASISWGTPMLPWPSVVFLVFQLSTAVLLLNRRISQTSKLQLFALGFLIAAAGFTRINYGIALAIVVGLLLLLPSSSIRLHAFEFWPVLFGLLSFSGAVLVSLIAKGSLVAFWDQAIFGALAEHGLSQRSPLVYWSNAYVTGSVLFLLALSCLWIFALKFPNLRKTLFLCTVVAILSLGFFATSALVNSPVRIFILARLSWSPGIDGQIAQPMFAAALTTLIFAIAFVFYFLHSTFQKYFGRGHQSIALTSEFDERQNSTGSPIRVTFTILLAISCASLIQLYPLGDPNHLWWAAPIPLVLLVFTYTSSLTSLFAKASLVALITVPFLAVGLVSAEHKYAIPRTLISAGPYGGMYIVDGLASNMLHAEEFFRDVPPQARYYCDSGIYPTWNGYYSADSAAYVQWAFYTSSAAQGIKAPKHVVVCAPFGNDKLVRAYLQSPQYELVRSVKGVTLSDYSSDDVYLFRKVNGTQKIN